MSKQQEFFMNVADSPRCGDFRSASRCGANAAAWAIGLVSSPTPLLGRLARRQRQRQRRRGVVAARGWPGSRARGEAVGRRGRIFQRRFSKREQMRGQCGCLGDRPGVDADPRYAHSPTANRSLATALWKARSLAACFTSIMLSRDAVAEHRMPAGALGSIHS